MKNSTARHCQYRPAAAALGGHGDAVSATIDQPENGAMPASGVPTTRRRRSKTQNHSQRAASPPARPSVAAVALVALHLPADATRASPPSSSGTAPPPTAPRGMEAIPAVWRLGIIVKKPDRTGG
uniref:Uncharacterized protein n=1 Tax=Oryza rufipogon TaxID=4529 RepID=A0A0E0PUB6_ORYRU